MAALLPIDVLRQLALPSTAMNDAARMSGSIDLAPRPTASWHMGPDGRPVCGWIVDAGIRGLSPN